MSYATVAVADHEGVFKGSLELRKPTPKQGLHADMHLTRLSASVLRSAEYYMAFMFGSVKQRAGSPSTELPARRCYKPR